MACFFLAVSNASLSMDLFNFGPSTVFQTRFIGRYLKVLYVLRDDFKKYFLQFYVHFQSSLGENRCSRSAIAMCLLLPSLMTKGLNFSRMF